MSGRRAATFRLAWRLVRKSRGRSALIALLVAIPVMAGTFAATTIRTAHLSPTEAADRQLGRADAIVAVAGGTRPLVGAYDVGRGNTGDTVSNIPARRGNAYRTDWLDALPAGSRITPDAWKRTVRVTVGNRTEDTQGVALDLHDAMTVGIYDVRVGRVPANGDEIALTRSLAKQLMVRVGQSIDLDERQLRVVAIVENPNGLDEQSAVGSAAAMGGLAGHANSNQNAPVGGNWYSGTGYWLVDTPDVAPDLHNKLLRQGVVYETRDEWAHPAPTFLGYSRQIDGQVLIVLGTVAGFGLLEVLLLAGAAFAVGTRRQTRELGLLAAVGDDDTDIRRSVLAQGALLGVGGALIGIAVGAAAVELLRGVLEQAAGKRFGALDVAAPDLISVAVLGVVAGLLAAIVPARAAAARAVLDNLRDRYRADGQRAPLPRWSLVAFVVGVTLTVVSAIAWHGRSGDLHTEYVGTGSPSAVVRGLVTLLRHNTWPAALWFGAALTLAGLVRACPAIVSRLGQLSRQLPLSPRLALRDAGRHRHRTAPAVAAVMTVVAGAVLVLFVVSSSDLRDKHEFRPAMPVGLINVAAMDDPGAGTHQSLDDAATRMETLIGGGHHVVIDEAHRPGGAFLVVQDPGCTDAATDDLAACQYHQVAVASASAIDLIVGRPVPAARRALASGGAVLLDPSLLDGRSVDVTTPGPSQHRTRLSAIVVPGLPSYGGLPQVYVSAETAAQHDWLAGGDQALIKPTTLPSTDLKERARRTLPNDLSVGIQRPYQSRYSVALLAMFGAAAIATLAGTSIAVALAMAESRSDMATFAAVGASPVRRRVHAMGQAATVAGLGTGIGVALGTLVAVATLSGSSLYPTSAPLRWLAAVLFGAPLLAIAVAGLFTRSQVPMTRRIA